MNYNNNFNFYIKELMNHIYKQKLYRLAYQLEKESLSHTDSSNLNKLIYSIINSNIILDIDTEETVRKFIESNPENYFMRKAISIEKNYLYPNLFDNNKNPKIDYSYTPALITLWKNDMDELYIEEVYNRFNKDSFIEFVKHNFDNILDDIISYIQNRNEANKILIKCNNKSDILDVMKSMILDKSLQFEWAEFLVDLDSLRSEMLALAGDLDIYSEFDKLEEETKYCLDNHLKYDSNQLFDILTKEKGFKWEDNVGLIYQ